ncbi:MAG: spore maturation protein [Clostridium sp.]|uniref:spore maturation protein n=1 Tax=Clostridium sp. TaxID=1506 RepID=UPI00290E956D|nr:nucleoside recognition domain-containing protein [Clostridium sp.]MDU7337971.1 spore maturation protein [Clostridium sp.]
MADIGSMVVPATIFFILIFGFVRKVPVFDVFVSGAKEGAMSCFDILPSLVGLILAVNMLSASGALDLVSSALRPAALALGLPPEVMPLALMRPVSGSGSNALLLQLFRDYGPDSFVGRVASVMNGSTETTFYAIAVYFGAVGIKKTRHTIPAALTADLVGYIASVWAVRILFL